MYTLYSRSQKGYRETDCRVHCECASTLIKKAIFLIYKDIEKGSGANKVMYEEGLSNI
jgi:hypothetical protein